MSANTNTNEKGESKSQYKTLGIDEELVRGLEFANSVLLSKSLQMINWCSLSSLGSKNKQLYSKQMQSHSKLTQTKNNNKDPLSQTKHSVTKSKFQKVPVSIGSKSSVKNKQSNGNNNSHTQVLSISDTNYSKVKQPLSLQSYIYSKVQGPLGKYPQDVIYQQQNQQITINSSSAPSLANPYHLHNPIINGNQWLTGTKSGINIDSIVTGSNYKLYNQNQYSMNDFLKQTSVSLSRNSHYKHQPQQQSSPITAWNHNSTQNNKVSSIEKPHQDSSPFKGITIHQSTSKSKSKNTTNISQPAPNSNKKSKFQKPNKSHQTNSYLSKPTIHQNKPTTEQNKHRAHQTQEISHQYEYSIPSQKQSDFDSQTRATCQLAPSKLQQLLEVQDNKYKQIILKTYFKHQK